MKTIKCTSKVHNMSEDCIVLQHNARHKTYEENLKNKVKDVPKRRKDKQIGTLWDQFTYSMPIVLKW